MLGCSWRKLEVEVEVGGGIFSSGNVLSVWLQLLDLWCGWMRLEVTVMPSDEI